jgi:DNA polymerase II large subunit
MKFVYRYAYMHDVCIGILMRNTNSTMLAVDSWMVTNNSYNTSKRKLYMHGFGFITTRLLDNYITNLKL